MLAPTARHALTQETKLRIQRGDKLDDVLAYLRRQGAGKIDSIVMLRGSMTLGLEEAKRFVHLSSAGNDVRKRDENIWSEFDEASIQIKDDNLS